MTESEQVSERTKHRLDIHDMMPADILSGEDGFRTETNQQAKTFPVA